MMNDRLKTFLVWFVKPVVCATAILTSCDVRPTFEWTGGGDTQPPVWAVRGRASLIQDG